MQGMDAAKGTPRQISRTFHGGARAAYYASREALVDQFGGCSDGLGNTFGQLLDRWLVECERLELSPTTMRTYRAQIGQTIPAGAGQGKAPSRLTPKHRPTPLTAS